jgi:hypothetical protein
MIKIISVCFIACLVCSAQSNFNDVNVMPRIGVASSVNYYNSAASYFVGLKAGTVGANITFTLPGADGTAGQPLCTDGSLNLSFCAQVAGKPAAPVSSVQFNNNGAFGGESNFTWSDPTLTVPSLALAFVGTQLAGPANTALLSATTNGLYLSLNGGVAGLIGVPSTPSYSVQFNNNGIFGGSPDFTFNSGLLTVTNGSIHAPNFESTAAPTAEAFFAGDFLVHGAGDVRAASLTTTTGGLSVGGSYGLTASGALTDVSEGLVFQANPITGPANTALLSATTNGLYLSLNGGIPAPFASPSTPSFSVQFNNNGIFGGSPYFTFNSGLLTVGDANGQNGSIKSPNFQSTASATGGVLAFLAGDFLVHGAGDVRALSLTTTTGGLSVGGTYGLTSAGALTISSCSGCPGVPAAPVNSVQFNNNGVFGGSSYFTWDGAYANVQAGTASGFKATEFLTTATGNLTAFSQTPSGTFFIHGDGSAFFDHIALTNGITTGNGAYGLTGPGVLTASNVGIGTTTPAYPFDLIDPGATLFRVAASTTGTPQIRFVIDGSRSVLQFWADSTPSLASAIGDGNPNATTGNGDIVFASFNGSAWAERMRLTNGGNLGIGTAAPTRSLSIDNGANTYMSFNNAGAEGWVIGRDPTAPGFLIYDIQGGKDRLTIQEGTGNVGIGTTAPAYLLDVAGTGRFTGAITVASCTGCGSTSSIPPATAAVLGGVKIGANVTVQADGTISVAAPGAAGAAGPTNAVQFNNNGSMGGSQYFTYQNAGLLQVGDNNGANGQIKAPSFQSSAPGNTSALAFLAGDFLVHGLGDVRAQSLSTTTGGITTNAITIGTNDNVSLATSGSGLIVANSGSANGMSGIGVQEWDTIGSCSLGHKFAPAGVACTSDARLKENMVYLNDPAQNRSAEMPNILKLKPASYSMIADPTHTTFYGFIAQDIQTVYPDAVTTNADGYLMLTIGPLIPRMVLAIQELDARLAALEAKQ